MMKRILLIVSLGVSFVAPAAFGATQDSPVFNGVKLCEKTTGVMSQCQLNSVTGLATYCDKQKAYNDQVAENLRDGLNGDGSSKALQTSH